MNMYENNNLKLYNSIFSSHFALFHTIFSIFGNSKREGGYVFPITPSFGSASAFNMIIMCNIIKGILSSVIALRCSDRSFSYKATKGNTLEKNAKS